MLVKTAHIILWVLISALWLNKSSAQVALPYSTGFDSGEGYLEETALGSPWGTDGTGIVTGADYAQANNFSLKIPSASPENLVSLPFIPAASTIIFVDYYAKLGAGAEPVLPLATTPNSTAVVGLRPATPGLGEWVLLDGDGSSSGQWFGAGGLLPISSAGLTTWQRVTLRVDLAANTWDLFINGEAIALDVGFAEPMTLGSEAIVLYGNSSGTTYIDSFQITATNPLFTDVDADGMDDSFEAANSLNTTIDDRDLDPDSDGLTNIQEFVFGLNPQDDSDGISDNDQDGFGASVEVQFGFSPRYFNGPLEGVVNAEWFGSIGGNDVADLTSHWKYPDSPDYEAFIAEIDIGQNVGSYFGTRVHGYIIPPETGNYHFWIAGDDEAELWLSTDQLQSNITKIAHTSYWYTGYRQWTKYSSQKSAAIPLVAGERYYFMALHKENTWSDHMSVAWTKPDSTFEMIPASALGSLVPNDMDLDGLPDTLEQAFVDADTTGTLNSIEDFDPDGDLDGDGLTNLYEFLVGLRMDLADTDGDGLSDKWEIENGYLGTHNQGNTGAFGDYDGDRLANHTESIAGSSVSIPDNAASLPNTLTKTGGNAAIHLIGRGSFTVTDSPTESTISE